MPVTSWGYRGDTIDFALRAAGWANLRADPKRRGGEYGDPGGEIPEILLGRPGGTPPYGDDKRDQYWIRRGYNWALHHYDPELGRVR